MSVPEDRADETAPLLKPPKNRFQFKENRSRYISLLIIFILTFFLNVQNTLYWSSLWPYLSEIDKTVDSTFLGIVIMSFNLGSALAAPLLGYWSNRLHGVTVPIALGVAINIAGNLLLAFAESFPDNRKWVVLAARFITGLGVGNSGCLYAYAVMASKLEERDVVITVRATINALALVLGPALQVMFVPIGYPGLVAGNFRLNMYTTPAFVNVLIGLLQLFILKFVFVEHWVALHGSDEKDVKGTLSPFDRTAASALLLARFVCVFSYSYDNTVGSPFIMVMFHWTRPEAVFYNGILQLSGGAAMAAVELFVGLVVLRHVQPRVIVLLAFVPFMLFYVFSFSYPGLPAMYHYQSVFSNLTNGSSSEYMECTFSWCDYTTRIHIWQYVIAYLLLFMAIGIHYVSNGTLFSKLIGKRKQGTMQGLFSAAEKLAMTLSPILVSTLFQYYGPRVAWAVGMSLIVAETIFLGSLYSRLVPHDGSVRE